MPCHRLRTLRGERQREHDEVSVVREVRFDGGQGLPSRDAESRFEVAQTKKQTNRPRCRRRKQDLAAFPSLEELPRRGPEALRRLVIVVDAVLRVREPETGAVPQPVE